MRHWLTLALLLGPLLWAPPIQAGLQTKTVRINDKDVHITELRYGKLKQHRLVTLTSKDSTEIIVDRFNNGTIDQWTLKNKRYALRASIPYKGQFIKFEVTENKKKINKNIGFL